MPLGVNVWNGVNSISYCLWNLHQVYHDADLETEDKSEWLSMKWCEPDTQFQELNWAEPCVAPYIKNDKVVFSCMFN